MKDLLNSKAVKVFCMFVIVFGWFAALVTGIALPVVAGYWFWTIPITAAVIVAAPAYLKALKWAVS